MTMIVVSCQSTCESRWERDVRKERHKHRLAIVQISAFQRKKWELTRMETAIAIATARMEFLRISPDTDLIDDFSIKMMTSVVGVMTVTSESSPTRRERLSPPGLQAPVPPRKDVQQNSKLPSKSLPDIFDVFTFYFHLYCHLTFIWFYFPETFVDPVVNRVRESENRGIWTSQNQSKSTKDIYLWLGFWIVLLLIWLFIRPRRKRPLKKTDLVNGVDNASPTVWKGKTEPVEEVEETKGPITVPLGTSLHGKFLNA